MKRDMKKQSGFTLIELMIVVVIVGVLAAIALPAYRNYVNKARVSEMLAATGGAKTAIEVCLQTDVPVANCTIPDSSSKYVTSVTGSYTTTTASIVVDGAGPVDAITCTLGGTVVSGAVDWTSAAVDTLCPGIENL